MSEGAPKLEQENRDARLENPAEVVMKWADAYIARWEAQKPEREAEAAQKFVPREEVMDEMLELLRQYEDIEMPRAKFREISRKIDELCEDKEYELAREMLAPQPSEERIEALQQSLEWELVKRREDAEEKWWEEHQDEIPPRNLFTHFAETADAMAEFEGAGWVKEQLSDAKYFDKVWRNKGLTLVDALQYFKQNEGTNGDFEIYGSGGGNRWFVRSDGSVELSGGHTPVIYRGGRREYVKKAKRHGFEVINYEYYAK